MKWNARSSLACEIGILWGLNGALWSEKTDSAIRSTLAAGGACRQEGLRALRFGRSGRSCGAARRSNSGWRLSGRGFLPGSGAEGRWTRGADARERPPGSAGGCGMGAAWPLRSPLWEREKIGSRLKACGFSFGTTKGERPYLYIIWVGFRSGACEAEEPN